MARMLKTSRDLSVYFLRFCMTGALGDLMGFSEMVMTSRMMECIRMFGSLGRLAFGRCFMQKPYQRAAGMEVLPSK